MTSDNPFITVEQVNKTFGELRAVNDLTFTVQAGEVFALLGPNGAGKTTTVRMLTGIIRPDTGTIRFRTREGMAESLSPALVGYLPEDRGLYQDVSIIKTLVFMGIIRGMRRHDARNSALQWLDRFDLGDRAAEKLGTLSKGNQQKVQLIASLLHHPQLAILDEPFSGLDPINQDLCLTIIRELKAAGATVLLSAHHMQLVERLADRVLLMDHGGAVLYGSLADIRQQWGADLSLHDIYVRQVGGRLADVASARVE